jgi:hypothetical protein
VSALELLVHGIRLLQALRIDVQDGLESRSLLVVGIDAIQILLDEIVARQRARLHRSVNVGNGGLDQMKGTIRTTAGDRHQQKGKQESGYS